MITTVITGSGSVPSRKVGQIQFSTVAVSLLEVALLGRGTLVDDRS
jgi:hypothetical protein